MAYIKSIVDLVINLGNKQISPTAVEDVLLLELQQVLHVAEFLQMSLHGKLPTEDTTL